MRRSLTALLGCLAALVVAFALIRSDPSDTQTPTASKSVASSLPASPSEARTMAPTAFPPGDDAPERLAAETNPVIDEPSNDLRLTFQLITEEGVDYTGQVASHIRCRGRPDGGFAYSWSRNDTCHGRFSVRVHEFPWPPGITRLELGGGDVANPKRGGRPRALVLNLTDRLQRGTNDLGRLFFLPVPVAVTGRVVDDLGQTVSFTSVTLARRPNTQDERVLMPITSTTADEDGAFVLYHPIDDMAALVVRADAPRRASASRTLSGPTHGLLLVTPRRGSARFRLTLDASIDVTDIGVIANNSPVRRLRGADPIDELDPGLNDLTFICASSLAVLANVPGVHIESGQVAQDPRLLPLDLRANAQAMQLVVRTAGQKPLSGADVTILDRQGVRTIHETDEIGGVRWVARDVPRSVLVTATMKQIVSVPARFGKHEVMLEDVIRVTLVPPETDDATPLYPRLYPLHSDPDLRAAIAARVRFPKGMFQADGFRVPAAGPYRVEWMASPRVPPMPGTPGAVPKRFGEGFVIEIAPSPRDQTIVTP